MSWPAEDSITVGARIIGLAAGLVILLFGVIAFGRETLSWLQDGNWPVLSVRHLLAYFSNGEAIPDPSTTFVGFNKLLVWGLDMQASAAAIGAGLVLAAFATTNLLRYVAAALVLLYLSKYFW